MSRTASFLLVFTALVLALQGVASACDSPSCCCHDVECQRQGKWAIAISQNFQVFSWRGSEEAQALAKECECHRASLATKLGLSAVAWTPRCQVYLYPSKSQYLRAVGPGSESTVGSTLVRPATGKILSRRIDLLAETEGAASATLPHELCHVLVADRFRDGPPPLWYDEGVALLADRPAKLAAHHRDLVDGFRGGTNLPLAILMTAKSYPSGKLRGVYYGECVSLIQWLHSQGPPEHIHRLAERSEEIGITRALQECYGIAGLPELERKWRRSIDRLANSDSASGLLTSTILRADGQAARN